MTSDQGTGDPPEGTKAQKQYGPMDKFYKIVDLENPPVKDSISPHPDDILEARLQSIESSLNRLENRLTLIFGDFVLDQDGRFFNIKKL